MTSDASESARTVDAGSRRERLLFTLWRRKSILIATFLAVTALTALISKSLPPAYQATSTLWISERSNTAFDAVQAGEVLARTYADVANTPIVAREVAAALPFEMSAGQVLGAMKFDPVTETQLLKITAEDSDPERAQTIANTYADQFMAYSDRRLNGGSGSDIAVAAEASTPGQPERPKPTAYTLVGALFGLLAGVGLALLADRLDRRVRSSEELGWLVPAPVLAHVPNNNGGAAADAAFHETFRLLRTNLQFIRRGGEHIHSLTIVSPTEGDGKSSVSYYLALSLADAGQRVALVEGDMRRPGLHGKVLGDGAQAVAGLSTYLSAATPDIEEVLYETSHPDLLFVPAGVLPPSPSTLLDAGNAQALINALSAHCSTVIIDTPPMSVGAEAATLAGSTDGSLMVIDLDHSNKAAIRNAAQQLDVVGADLLGMVLNRERGLPDLGGYAYHQRDTERVGTGATDGAGTPRAARPPGNRHSQ